MQTRSSIDRYLQPSLHLLAWLLVFGLPLLFWDFFEAKGTRGYFRMWLPPLFSLLIFYLNYFLLVPGFLYRKKNWAFFLFNIAAILCSLTCMELIRELFAAELISDNRRRPPMAFIAFRNGVTLTLVAALSTAIQVTRRWYHEEQTRKQVEGERLRAELALLKHQLNPHFFFNMLNTIYALIEQRPDDAQSALHKLSKMMRYMLYDTEAEFSRLEQEVSFLNNYIDLMRLRLLPSTSLDVHLGPVRGDMSIPPLLFVPFVENAFKHGVSAQRDSKIAIRLEQDQDCLRFQTVNSVFRQQAAADLSAGIGLSNIRQRLELLYPGQYELAIHHDDDIFTVNLSICPNEH